MAPTSEEKYAFDKIALSLVDAHAIRQSFQRSTKKKTKKDDDTESQADEDSQEQQS